MESPEMPATKISFNPIYEEYLDPTSKKTFSYSRPLLSTIIVVFGLLATGTTSGYPAMAIPNINENYNSSFYVNHTQESWFVSIKYLAGIPGALISVLIIDRYGRKPVFFIGLMAMFVGWIFIMSAESVEMLDSGRVFTGLASSLIISASDVYISEISPPEIRGRLMSMNELFLNLGILFAYVVGDFIPWNWSAALCSLFPFISMIGMVFLPESPRWLLLKGRTEAALKSLMWHKSTTESSDVIQEFAIIEASLVEAHKAVPVMNYLKWASLKFFVTSLVMFSLQGLCGISIIRFYSFDIVETAGTHYKPKTYTIIVGAAFVISSSLCTFLIDRFERRTLLMVSGLMMGISMSAVGIFYEEQATNFAFASTFLFWLPLVAICTAIFGFTMGYGPLPGLVSSEIYSTAARGRGNSCSVAVMEMCGFLSTNYFMEMNDIMGKSGPFWVCAGICYFGAIFCYFMIPDTKGKTLEEIQDKLN